MAVDIGLEAINRVAGVGDDDTSVNAGAAASIAGIVTSIDIWALTDITGLKVGTFYKTNGNTLKCRDAKSIAGTITAGSKVNKVVSLTVEIGDYIGCIFTGGWIERDSSGYAGLWQVKDVDNCIVDAEDDYDLLSGDGISLGGYIEEAAAAGRSFGFIFG